MTDIVERLRASAAFAERVEFHATAEEMREAAAEIERLRAEKRAIAMQALVDQGQAQEHWQEAKRLRALLPGAWEAGRDAAQATARSFGDGPFAAQRAALAIAALCPPPDLADQLSKERAALERAP